MATEKIVQHITIDGERWDQVAHKYYGRADLMNKIIVANPGVPLHDILPAGVVLNIPIIDSVEVKTDKELLPPWKQ